MAFKLPISINTQSTADKLPNFITKVVNINFGYIEHDIIATKIDKQLVSFKNSPMSSAAVSGEVSLKGYFKEISDQRTLSSCVANATADTAEAIEAKTKNVSPANIPNLSRLFIYYNARNNMNPPAMNIDKGTYISLAFDTLSRYGVPKEETWGYYDNQVNMRPSVLAYREALSHKFLHYYSINSGGDTRVADIIKSLSSGYPVVFGTGVDANFLNTSGSFVVGPPSESSLIGRHAMVVVSWSDSKKAFEVRNSWGPDWRNNGYVWLTPEYLKADMTKDIWVLTE